MRMHLYTITPPPFCVSIPLILQKICCGADAHSHDDNISWDGYFLASLRFETDGHVIDRGGLEFPVELDAISFMELITKREPMINRTENQKGKEYSSSSTMVLEVQFVTTNADGRAQLSGGGLRRTFLCFPCQGIRPY